MELGLGSFFVGIVLDGWVGIREFWGKERAFLRLSLGLYLCWDVKRYLNCLGFEEVFYVYIVF